MFTVNAAPATISKSRPLPTLLTQTPAAWLVKLAVLCVIGFMCLLPLTAHGNEDPVPNQAAQSGESVASSGGFSLNFSIGYGFSFATSALVAGQVDPSPTTKRYFDELGLESSNNILVAGFTPSFAITDKIGVFGYLPFGIVQTRADDLPPALIGFADPTAGIGDVSFGGYLHAVQESHYFPNLIVTAQIDSAVARYSSLGDGFWSAAAGLSSRKYLDDTYYVTFTGDWTRRFGKASVDPAPVYGVGGGFGALVGNGTEKIEAQIKFVSELSETEVGDSSLPKNADLAFRIQATSFIGEGSTIGITIGNLNNGFDIERNNFLFDMTFPLHFWTWFDE